VNFVVGENQMKLNFWIFLILIFILSLSACGKTAGKNELIAYYKKQIQWMQSPDFNPSIQKDPEKGLKKIQDMMASCGFESLEELMAISAKYKEDPAVKRLTERIMKMTHDIRQSHAISGANPNTAEKVQTREKDPNTD